MNFKKVFWTLVAIMAAVIPSEAKTKVILFIPKVGNTDFTLFIDGEKTAKLNTPIVKTTDYSTFKIPLKQSQPGWVEIDFANEGKVLLSVSMEYTNFMTLDKNTMQAETQIDLQDDDTIYLELGRKGLNDCKLKILDEKKGVKKLADKKLFELPKLEINNE